MADVVKEITKPEGEITKPSISLRYAMTVGVFLLMLFVVGFVLVFLWNKGRAVAVSVVPQAEKYVPEMSIPSGNPMIPNRS